MPWTTVGDIILHANDKETLKSGGWLNDKHINASQLLLKKRHPHLSNLQSTLLQATNLFDVQGSCVLVQMFESWWQSLDYYLYSNHYSLKYPVFLQDISQYSKAHNQIEHFRKMM